MLDCAIIGGGYTGGVLASLLAQAGHRIAVVDATDPSQHPTQDGRSFAIARGSVPILESAGCWDAQTQAQAHPICAIRVADGHPVLGIAPSFVHFEESHPFGYNIETSHLLASIHRGLAHAVEHHALTWCTGQRVVALEAGENTTHATVQLADGTQWEASLVIACDGRFSWVRTRLGIHTTHWDYKQKALVCSVKPEQDHGGAAVELFYPRGPFAMLPLPNGRVNVIWIEPERHAKAIEALDDGLFMDALQQRFGDWLGALTLDSPRQSFPLRLDHAHRYGHARVLLAGDAAHAIHPLAGQGVNLGFRDCATLETLIARTADAGLDIGTHVLHDYERQRRPDSQAMIMATDGLNRLFSNPSMTLRIARALGMSAVQHCSPLKTALTRYATGFSTGPRALA